MGCKSHGLPHAEWVASNLEGAQLRYVGLASTGEGGGGRGEGGDGSRLELEYVFNARENTDVCILNRDVSRIAKHVGSAPTYPM